MPGHLRAAELRPRRSLPIRLERGLGSDRRERTKLQVAHIKLSHSRAFVLRAYLLQSHEMLTTKSLVVDREVSQRVRDGLVYAGPLRSKCDGLGSGERQHKAGQVLFSPRPVHLERNVVAVAARASRALLGTAFKVDVDEVSAFIEEEIANPGGIYSGGGRRLSRDKEGDGNQSCLKKFSHVELFLVGPSCCG